MKEIFKERCQNWKLKEWHINLRILFNGKVSFLAEQFWYDSTHNFSKRISPKVNVIIIKIIIIIIIITSHH